MGAKEETEYDPFRAALDAVPEPTLLLDSQRAIRFANRAFFSFFPVAARSDGTCTIPIEQFWPTVHAADFSRDEFRGEWHLDGHGTYSVKLAIHQLPDHSVLVRVIAGSSSQDVVSTYHAQRLETLGMLASGVAHDFNNVLTGILGHMAYLRTILPPNGPHVESLRSIEEGAKKASGLSQQILNFSKLNATEESVEVDLGDLTARTVGLLRGAISPEYRINYEKPTERLCLFGSEGRLAQIIINLAVNARDAINAGGEVGLRVWRCSDTARLEKLFGSSELPCASYVVLTVTDNGHGMTRDVMERMFEPYFSTKKGKGTGLGLSTVSAIVRDLGGTIAVRSEVNVGTEIDVYFPIVHAFVPESAPSGQSSAYSHAQAPATQSGGISLAHGSEHILVVDDEYSVRNVLALSLQHLGYRVEVAASGAEALDLYTRGHDGFDLVILDMLMPQLSGDRVFFKLKEFNPKVKVLLISGFASEESVRAVLRNGGLGFIQKPFTIEELAARVRTCFDEAVLTKSERDAKINR